MQQFNWEVLTQDQILAQQANLEPGEYDFEVMSSIYKISSTGNPMVELVLKIFDSHGRERTCYDYLVGTANMAYKTKHFWESVGHPEFYEKGGCTEGDFLSKQGRCKTKLEKSKNGDRLNIKVVDYVVDKSVEDKPKNTNFDNSGGIPTFDNDDVTF